jgi:hypothetical protein
MVSAFNQLSEHVRPPLKLGHTDEQKLLQKDGLPAAGWVGRLYRQGARLLADFVDLPEKIYELIKLKAYRNVSSEIYWDVSIGEKKFKRMLSGVALLGADTPAVMNLSDILALYSNGVDSIGLSKSYLFNQASSVAVQNPPKHNTVDTEIRQYMSRYKVDYGKAYRAVLRTKL